MSDDYHYWERATSKPDDSRRPPPPPPRPGVICTCHRYAMAHTLDAVRSRIRWWQTELAYKAPEQIEPADLQRMLDDIAVAACMTASQPSPGAAESETEVT